MGYQIPGKTITLVAGEDIAAYKAVTVNADGQAVIAGADALIVGVVQLPDSADHAVPVMINGVTQVIYGADVVSGASLSTNADGDFITATTGNVAGIALETGVAGVHGTMLLK